MSDTAKWVAIIALVAILALGGGTAIVTITTRQGFLRAIGQEVARQLSELRPDLTDEQRNEAGAIIAAQAAFETGYGATIAWRQGWNFGNVTAGSSWTGEIVPGPDTEYDAAGNVTNITQAFRKYPDLPAAVSDYLVGVLDWKREKAAGSMEALLSGDAGAYVQSLASAGYFTLPVDQYLAGVNAALPGAEEAIS